MIYLTVATTNPGKLAEMLAELRSDPGLKVDASPLPDNFRDLNVPEDKDTFMDNAIQKAVFYSTLINGLVLAEDSGLSIHRLDGWPGVNSKRIADADEERNSLVLQRLEGIIGCIERGASFASAVAVARLGVKLFSVYDSLQGTILHRPQGQGGFGFDPIFAVRGSELGVDPGWHSLAEIGPERKSKISPRTSALQRTAWWLSEYDRARRKVPPFIV